MGPPSGMLMNLLCMVDFKSAANHCLYLSRHGWGLLWPNDFIAKVGKVLYEAYTSSCRAQSKAIVALLTAWKPRSMLSPASRTTKRQTTGAM